GNRRLAESRIAPGGGTARGPRGLSAAERAGSSGGCRDAARSTAFDDLLPTPRGPGILVLLRTAGSRRKGPAEPKRTRRSVHRRGERYAGMGISRKDLRASAGELPVRAPLRLAAGLGPRQLDCGYCWNS